MTLHPSTLGTISVVMRANKSDNSLSISMNMSSGSTMDVFADNKTALQNALVKNLGSDTNISLNFGMQQGNSNNAQQQNSQSNFTNNRDIRI